MKNINNPVKENVIKEMLLKIIEILEDIFTPSMQIMGLGCSNGWFGIACNSCP
ncbi:MULTISPECIES: hypothetical protein [unclassified Clostridium]|uniref:hypothetical protein n=1 Tax=unclassified Clostridium TaxID=2614128 RepID=UPI0013D89004